MSRIFAIILSFLPFSAMAHDEYPPLKIGMLPNEVIRLWGPAIEKSEFGARNAEEWRYAQARVLYAKGRVREWQVSNEMRPNAQPFSPQMAFSTKPDVGFTIPVSREREQRPGPNLSSGDLHELFSAIAKEGGPDSPSGSGGGQEGNPRFPGAPQAIPD